MENYLVGIVKDLLLCSELNSDDLEPETVHSIFRAKNALANTEHATPEQVKAANDMYRNDDIEIDPDALRSRADEGYWISAWVYMADDELGSDQFAHRRNAGYCAKCGGTCDYDDDGNRRPPYTPND